jgi:hypothetical protein
MKNVANNQIQSQSVDWNSSSDCCGPVQVVAVDSKSEMKVHSLSINCCFTAHNGLRFNGSHLDTRMSQPGSYAEFIQVKAIRRIENSTLKMINKSNNKHDKKIVIANNTSKFTLLKRPEIAPKDMQPGVITVVTKLTGTNNGEEFEQMDIPVQLEAKDSKGQPFTLTKSYNLAESGRGIAMFLKDYNSLMNTNLTKTDLYDFDPRSLNGMHVVVEVAYSQIGSEVVSVIKSFHPPQQHEAAPAPALETPAA